jgi:membrane fusion protein, adhesin transport system
MSATLTWDPRDDQAPGWRFSFAIWGAVLALLAFLGWASVAEIDEITRGQGQIIPSTRTQVIQVADGGVLEVLKVREGDSVQRGDVIARLEQGRAQAAHDEASAAVAALAAALARVRAEVFGGPPQFPPSTSRFPEFRQNQVQLLQKRRTALAEELAVLERMKQLTLSELQMTEPLLATGDVSLTEVLRLQRQVADLDGQATNRRNRHLQEVQAEMVRLEEELASATQILVQRNEQLNYTEIVAPVNGTVKNIRVTTLGGVLRPGEELLSIVPADDTLVVEARVRPADVAYLQPGLEVAVKIDAYDPSVYGSLDGTLIYVSADTLSEDMRQGEQPYYRVQVLTESPRFSRRPAEALRLQPGMTASIEIKTGKKTVLNYLLKPVVKTLDESLGER